MRMITPSDEMMMISSSRSTTLMAATSLKRSTW